MRRALSAIGRQLAGLFVDSGGLALAIVLWIAAVALLRLPAALRGAALFGGLAVALAASCLRHGAGRR